MSLMRSDCVKTQPVTFPIQSLADSSAGMMKGGAIISHTIQ